MLFLHKGKARMENYLGPADYDQRFSSRDYIYAPYFNWSLPRTGKLFKRKESLQGKTKQQRWNVHRNKEIEL